MTAKEPSVYQVVTRIWNEIASTQRMATAKWERLFRMEPEALDAALQAEEERLAAEGVPNRVIRAYMALAPLLDENRAVTRYVEGTASPAMRTFLPELTSPDELMIVAQEEYRLTPLERAALARLIEGGWIVAEGPVREVDPENPDPVHKAAEAKRDDALARLGALLGGNFPPA